jgi:membrane-bound serine protease (ClpP class)
MLTLVAAPVPELAVNPALAIAVAAAFGTITFFLVRLVVRAQRKKHKLGADALVGSRASAMEPLNLEGHVLVEGEIWRAIASEPVAEGSPLRVTGHEEYLLHVAPMDAPRAPTAAA